MSQKQCNQCGVNKPLTDFYVNTNGTTRERCKHCAIEQAKAHYRANSERAQARVRELRHQDPRVRMAHDARARDRRKGLPSDIEAAQIFIPTHCPVLGIPMTSQAGHSAECSPSIDHFDNNLGAVRGNWRVISKRANQLKRGHTALSLATYIHELELGRKRIRGRVTLGEYRAVLRYLEGGGLVCV